MGAGRGNRAPLAGPKGIAVDPPSQSRSEGPWSGGFEEPNVVQARLSQRLARFTSQQEAEGN